MFALKFSKMSLSLLAISELTISDCNDSAEGPRVDASLSIECGEEAEPAMRLQARLTGSAESTWYLHRINVWASMLDDEGSPTAWARVELGPPRDPIVLDAAGRADAVLELSPQPEARAVLCQHAWQEFFVDVSVSPFEPGSAGAEGSSTYVRGTVDRTP